MEEASSIGHGYWVLLLIQGLQQYTNTGKIKKIFNFVLQYKGISFELRNSFLFFFLDSIFTFLIGIST